MEGVDYFYSTTKKGTELDMSLIMGIIIIKILNTL